MAGHVEVVEALLARGARADVNDGIYGSDAAGWAEHHGHEALAARLRGA